MITIPNLSVHIVENAKDVRIVPDLRKVFVDIIVGRLKEAIEEFSPSHNIPRRCMNRSIAFRGIEVKDNGQKLARIGDSKTNS